MVRVADVAGDLRGAGRLRPALRVLSGALGWYGMCGFLLARGLSWRATLTAACARRTGMLECG